MSLTNSSYFIRNGLAYSCGYNNSGQLGLGNTTNHYTPTLISSLSNVKQISCGNGHALFLLNDGSVYSCGNNSNGQLGLGNTTEYHTPTLISSLSNVKQIACGDSHTLFLLKDGSVYSCGSNGTGQLGLGNANNYSTPTLISSLSNVKQIACGISHTIFLLNDGSVYSCGNNSYGQLGSGTTNARYTPKLSSLNNVKQIACGYYYTLFLLRDGSVYSCGSNNYGQLGLGTSDTNSHPTPTLISLLSNVKQISCGYGHTIFLLNDGSAYSCGYNASGQLGLGTSDNNSHPIALISSLSNVKQIVCGYYHTLFLLNDGSVYSCGANGNGQLGSGNTTAYTTPQLISSLSNVNYLQDIAILYIIKVLIQDGSNLCKSDDGIQLIISDSLPYTKDKFVTYGMASLSNITPAIISKIINQKYNIGLLKS